MSVPASALADDGGARHLQRGRRMPDIEALVEDLLDGVDANRGFDFMHQLARPLPARVMARLMGIDDAEDRRFIAWSDDLAAFIGASSLLFLLFEGVLTRRPQ